MKVYKFIREHGGWDDWQMVLVEKTPCNDKIEAVKFENEYYEKLGGTLNSNVPARTKKQYYVDNKNKIIEQHKEHYQQK